MELNPSSYAPSINVTCPESSKLLRIFSASNQLLSSGEIAYVDGREQVMSRGWQDWLGDGSQLGYNLTTFNNAFPKLAIANSGGGFRASLFAAGIMVAFDGRNQTAKNRGTGGLLQVSQYVSGSSGLCYVSSCVHEA